MWTWVKLSKEGQRCPSRREWAMSSATLFLFDSHNLISIRPWARYYKQDNTYGNLLRIKTFYIGRSSEHWFLWFKGTNKLKVLLNFKDWSIVANSISRKIKTRKKWKGLDQSLETMHRVTEILKKTLNSYSMRSFVSWQITQKSDNYVYYKKGLSNNEQQTGEPVQQSP